MGVQWSTVEEAPHSSVGDELQNTLVCPTNTTRLGTVHYWLFKKKKRGVGRETMCLYACLCTVCLGRLQELLILYPLGRNVPGGCGSGEGSH